MAQHDYNIANQSGAAFRADLNNALAAIVSQNSGAAEPSTTYAYMLWADTTNGLFKIRNAANNAWITLRELDGTLTIEGGSASTPGLYFSGDANTGIYSPGADQLGIATSGSERLRIDSSGNVIINGQGDLRFNDSDNSNWVALQAPATVSSNVTWTLPAADGTADQVLKTNGSGALGWTSTTPPGTVIWHAATSAPAGYLKANGALISRTTYAALFSVIGTTFGAGDGSTTFALPDLRGEFIRSWDDGRGLDSGRAIGSWQDHLYASHSHSVTDPGHSHNIVSDVTQGSNSSTFYILNGVSYFRNTTTTSVGTGISIQNSGGSETRPRNIALLAIIKY